MKFPRRELHLPS